MLRENSRAPSRARHSLPFAVALCTSFAVWIPQAYAAVTPEAAGMINVQTYNANPTLSVRPENTAADNSEAMANIITSAKSANKTIFIPYSETSYKFAERIRGIEGSNGDCGSHTQERTVVIIGEQKEDGSRPTLELEGNSEYQNSEDQIPFIQIASNEAADGEGADCAYADGLRGVILNLGPNPGVVGIDFGAAQDSFLEDVKVIATNAHKGIIAIPGRGMSAVNIEVDGGRFGIDLDDVQKSLGGTLVGVRLTNQSEVAFRTRAGRGMAVTGLEIVTSAPTAIQLAGPSGNGYPGHLSLYDASITMNGGQAERRAISNPDERGVALTNVYVNGATTIVDHGAQDNATGDLGLNNGATFNHVLSYARAAQVSGLTGAYSHGGQITRSPTDPGVDWGTGTAVPPNLVTQHVWGDPVTGGTLGRTISVTHSQVKTVFNAGTTANVAGLLQTEINKNDPNVIILIPAGTYRLDAPLVLRPNTRIIGVPGLRSKLKPNGWAQSVQNFVIKSKADNATEKAANLVGKTLVQDLAFDVPISNKYWIGGIHWQFGPYSQVRRVKTGLQPGHTEPKKIEYMIEGNGGGRWYSLTEHKNVYDDTKPQCTYRKLVIKDTATNSALSFYGLNIERGGSKRRAPQYPFIELINAKNVRAFGQKMETDGANSAASASDTTCKVDRTNQPINKGIGWDITGTSSNIFIGSLFINDVRTPAQQIQVGSSVQNIELDLVYAAVEGTSSAAYPLLKDMVTSEKIRRDEWLGRFKRGTVDHTKFVHKLP